MAKSRFDYKSLKNLALITHVGFVMLIPIFAGVYIGRLVDGWVGTQSLFLLIGVVLGVMTAFLNLYRLTMKKFMKKENDDE